MRSVAFAAVLASAAAFSAGPALPLRQTQVWSRLRLCSLLEICTGLLPRTTEPFLARRYGAFVRGHDDVGRYCYRGEKRLQPRHLGCPVVGFFAHADCLVSCVLCLCRLSVLGVYRCGCHVGVCIFLLVCVVSWCSPALALL